MWHGRIAALAALGMAGTGVFAAEPPALTLSSHASGATARHGLVFTFAPGEPEIHGAVLTYPKGFRFEGFDRLGPAGTPVGRYELDLNLDGSAERTSALLALASDAAWVDLQPDGVFSTSFEPLLRHGGATRFELRLPLGGDADRDTLVAAFGAAARLALFEGLLVNPPLGGSYPVVVETVSVDPDTGGGSDGGGAAPETRRFELPLAIVGPTIAPFAHLEVDRLALRTGPHDRTRFKVRGRYVTGAASDGIDLARENVTVAFDGFRQTIPGSAFVATGDGYHLRAAPPGIQDFRLWDDGRFQIDGRDLARIAVPPVVTFVLAIGNDRGEAPVALDGKRGHGRP